MGAAPHALSGRTLSPGQQVGPGSPVVRHLHTHDFDALAGALERWDHRWEQLSPGPFVGDLRVILVDGLQLAKVTVNQVVQARGSQPPGNYGFVPVSPTNEGALWRGQRYADGFVVIVSPTQQYDHLTCKGESLVLMTVAGELVRRGVAALLGGRDLEDCLADKVAVAGAPAACVALRARLEQALSQPVGTSALLDRPGGGTVLAKECVRWLLQTINPLVEVGKTEAITANRRLVVRRAEDYLHAHFADPVTILDLCEEVGVSERALHYAFQDLLGLSPMAYFKIKRLNGVRHALKAAHPGAATVAGIAQDWGFWHTGNFAADYCRLFGELPSQTFSSR